MKKHTKHFRDLVAYKRAFDAARHIFQMTKAFPPEERYSLVDQIRKASRSSCSCLAEPRRKPRCTAVFRNKVTEAMQEASERQCWLEFSFACGSISERDFHELDEEGV